MITELIFWLLAIADILILDYYLRGDRANYEHFLVEFWDWLYGLWNSNVVSSNPNGDTQAPTVLNRDASRPELFIASANTPLEEILRRHSESAQNIELNRQAERTNLKSKIEYLELQLKRTEDWRNNIKWLTILTLLVHCVVLYIKVYQA